MVIGAMNKAFENYGENKKSLIVLDIYVDSDAATVKTHHTSHGMKNTPISGGGKVFTGINE